ncbi:MAG: outer membrane protein assembly factor BamD [Candidatus Acidiferrales bacterium]
MAGILSKRIPFLAGFLGLALAASICGSAYAQKPKVYKVKPAKTNPKAAQKTAQAPDDTAASAEPDKVLYERALNDIKHGKYTEGRLSLQTLINTYPDSEYLAKAKLSAADSYYKEGGVSNLTQAIAEYKDFITFFPFLDEASYAQMQVGMAHYRMMEKADRDNAQAEAAEDEFQAFLLKYPQSPLLPKAEQHLREVQEVLGAGEYEIAHFYYMKPDYRAAAARLVELTDRYPLYSASDEALWMLADIYSRAKQASKNEDDKNHWADLAAKCYDRIVQDYPLSGRAGPSKQRLAAMGMPVPSADPRAAQRMKDQQQYARAHRQKFFIRGPLSLIKSSPDISIAARSGMPNMTPPTDTISATDILKPGAPGPTFGIVASTDAGGAASTSDTEGVDSGVSSDPASSGQTVTAPGVEILTPTQVNTAPAVAGSAPPPTSVPGQNPAVNPSPTSSPDATPSTLTPIQGSGAPITPDAAASSSPAPQVQSNVQADPVQPAPAPAHPSSGAYAAPPENARAGAQSKSKNESSSKKKKGLKKIVPW